MAELLYNLLWTHWDPLERELFMIKKGGRYKKSASGKMAGNGLEFHFRRAQQLMWPEKVWHKWSDVSLKCYLGYRTICELGPASSGKSFEAACNVLTDYYAFPYSTTVLCCSTTREMLENRVWGEIKKLHRLAKQRFPWLPGNLIEGRLRIITDSKGDVLEGRDFRNGLQGVPCKKGDDQATLGDFAGIKNKRVRVIADELSLLPRGFIHVISNLDKNPDLKVIGLGNPKETTDALGTLAEPSAAFGGWDGGIDQAPGTKTWEIRRPQGICIQKPGSDSPNLDGKLGIPLITQEAIDRDVAFYGTDSEWFAQMDEGRMPKGQGSRRVLTRQLCLKNHAMEEPTWANANLTRIGFLDAAYRAVGGDRCVFGELNFGDEAPQDLEPVVSAIVSQRPNGPRNKKQLLWLKDTMLVPIKQGIEFGDAEDQIAEFCKAQCEARSIPATNFFYDAGMRSSLVTAFARQWSPAVNAIDFGGKPSERPVSAAIEVSCRDYYSKFVTELWWAVRLIVEAAQFRGMTEEVMLEGCSREWTRVAGNKIEVEPKEKMKLKTGRSPDLFDALVAGVEGARRLGFQILNTARRQAPNSRDNQWKRDLEEKARQLWHGRALVRT